MSRAFRTYKESLYSRYRLPLSYKLTGIHSFNNYAPGALTHWCHANAWAIVHWPPTRIIVRMTSALPYLILKLDDLLLSFLGITSLQTVYYVRGLSYFADTLIQACSSTKHTLKIDASLKSWYSKLSLDSHEFKAKCIIGVCHLVGTYVKGCQNNIWMTNR